MQSLTKMNKVVIDDYYHMTIMNENMNWMKLTHLSKFSFKPYLKTLLYILHFKILNNLLYIYTCFKVLISFLNVHTKEKQYPSLIYTMYTSSSNNIPSYTHISSYVAWRVHPEQA